MTIHIIIIANSFQARVAEAYCKKKMIGKDSIALVKLRPIRWSLDYKYLHSHFTNRPTQFIWKAFSFSINTLILKIKLNLIKKKYILIAPWHNEYLELLAGKSNCIGTYYCEEGDLSYWSDNVMFDGNDNNKKYNLARRIGPVKKWLFDKNCSGFICTSDECFPQAEQSMKEVIELSTLDYCNVSKKGDVIGVMPSAARITKINMVKLLREYKKYAPQGALNYVKIHPSFHAYPKLELELHQALKLSEFSNTEIMNENIDLELEILANPLTLIGLDSSVERFAIKNDSNYIKVSSLLVLQSDR